MYFPDLSPYRYRSNSSAPYVLNVGWLDVEHPFPKKIVSEELLDALFERCLQSVNRTRGVHPCPLCRTPSFGVKISRKGNNQVLGSAEIWVEAADGKVYAAPNLIYHYVAEHDYHPPQEFIDVLLR